MARPPGAPPAPGGGPPKDDPPQGGNSATPPPSEDDERAEARRNHAEKQAEREHFRNLAQSRRLNERIAAESAPGSLGRIAASFAAQFSGIKEMIGRQRYVDDREATRQLIRPAARQPIRPTGNSPDGDALPPDAGDATASPDPSHEATKAGLGDPVTANQWPSAMADLQAENQRSAKNREWLDKNEPPSESARWPSRMALPSGVSQWPSSMRPATQTAFQSFAKHFEVKPPPEPQPSQSNVDDVRKERRAAYRAATDDALRKAPSVRETTDHLVSKLNVPSGQAKALARLGVLPHALAARDAARNAREAVGPLPTPGDAAPQSPPPQWPPAMAKVREESELWKSNHDWLTRRYPPHASAAWPSAMSAPSGVNQWPSEMRSATQAGLHPFAKHLNDPSVAPRGTTNSGWPSSMGWPDPSSEPFIGPIPDPAAPTPSVPNPAPPPVDTSVPNPLPSPAPTPSGRPGRAGTTTGSSATGGFGPVGGGSGQGGATSAGSAILQNLSRFFAALPTGGSVGVAAKAGWTAAGTAMAKGVQASAMLSGSGTSGYALMGVPGAAIAGAITLGRMAWQVSEATHAGNVRDVLPYSASYQNTYIQNTMKGLQRDIAYARNVEDAAIFADNQRNFRDQQLAPLQQAGGNLWSRISGAFDWGVGAAAWTFNNIGSVGRGAVGVMAAGGVGGAAGVAMNPNANADPNDPGVPSNWINQLQNFVNMAPTPFNAGSGIDLMFFR